MSDQPRPPQHIDEVDPASEAMAEALQRMFGVLRWIMMIVLVVYCLSGLFQVRPGQVGYVLRMGELINDRLDEGWHMTWPFPIDEARTLSIKEDRKIDTAFSFKLNEMQLSRGVTTGGSLSLRPGRDHYILTGDLNILHANLSTVYKINEPLDYLRNIYRPMELQSEEPEYDLIRDLVYASTVDVAAGGDLNFVYKNSEFLDRVRDRSNERLDAMSANGSPCGIRILRVELVPIDGKFEGIVPPLAIKPHFDAVQTAEQRKGTEIVNARAGADSMLREISGTTYQELADAIDAEYDARTAGSENLAELEARCEQLLNESDGLVQMFVTEARNRRDRIIKEAYGDAEIVRSLAEEYRKNPQLVMSRLRWTRMREILRYPSVNRILIPNDLREVRLTIERDPSDQERATVQREQFRKNEEERREQEETGTIGKEDLRIQGPMRMVQ